MNKAGEKCSYSTGEKLPESTGDKLPKSTGEDDSTFLGKPLDCTGEWFHWGVCIPPGNNLILRLPGMLAQEHLYTPLGNVEIFWGISNFLKVDCRLTLLGESVVDLLEILCLFRANGSATLLEENC